MNRCRLWRTFWRNKTAVVGVAVALGIMIMAATALVIAPYDPLRQNVFYRLTEPERSHLFGTEVYGGDVLSRMIYAAWISLLVGINSVFAGMAILVTILAFNMLGDGIRGVTDPRLRGG